MILPLPALSLNRYFAALILVDSNLPAIAALPFARVLQDEGNANCLGGVLRGLRPYLRGAWIPRIAGRPLEMLSWSSARAAHGADSLEALPICWQIIAGQWA